MKKSYDWFTHNSINSVIKSEYIPKESQIRMLFKGKEKEKMGNYRDIYITSNVGKLFSSMIARRLDTDAQNINLQFGFQRDNRTTDALYFLSQLIKRETLYDRADRDILLLVLGNLGYGGQFLRLIKSMYT